MCTSRDAVIPQQPNCLAAQWAVWFTVGNARPNRWLTSPQCILGILGHGIGLVQYHQFEAFPGGQEGRTKRQQFLIIPLAVLGCRYKGKSVKNIRFWIEGIWQILSLTWKWSWCWQNSERDLWQHQCLCRLMRLAAKQMSNQTVTRSRH